MSTPGNRDYSNAVRALLWSISGSLCAFPDCDVICVLPANDNDPAVTIGRIAHIESFSDEGPRANPSLTIQQRNSYDNLIILCGNHHTLVDTQPNTYTVELLSTWKAAQEERHEVFLAQAMRNITYTELDQITNALVNGEQLPISPITVIPPQEKMARNGLTEQSGRLFTMGLVQTQLVKHYVETTSSLDRTFVPRLTSGSIDHYQQQTQAGLQGDALFAEMFRFSAQGRSEYQYQSAGLAVLVYLFESCEVFER